MLYAPFTENMQKMVCTQFGDDVNSEQKKIINWILIAFLMEKIAAAQVVPKNFLYMKFSS